MQVLVSVALASSPFGLGTGAVVAMHISLKGHADLPTGPRYQITMTGRFSPFFSPPLQRIVQEDWGMGTEKGRVGTFNISNLISDSGSICAHHRPL